MTSDSKKTIVEGKPDIDKEVTEPVAAVEKQEDSQKVVGGGWAEEPGKPNTRLIQEDELRGHVDSWKDKHRKLFLQYDELKMEHNHLKRNYDRLTADPQYKGLQKQIEELRANEEESNKKYVALINQNSGINKENLNLKKKHTGRYALIGSTGAVVGFLAGLLFSDCSGSGSKYAGHVRNAWDSGLYAQCTEAIDGKEDRISELEQELLECLKDNSKLSKRPKYCPKPKKEELVCPPQPECPYIKQY